MFVTILLPFAHGHCSVCYRFVLVTGARVLHQLAIDNFTLPGDPSFPLGGMIPPPQNRTESGNSLVAGVAMQSN